MGDSFKLVSRQRIRQAESSYVVEVFADRGGCLGAWHCPQCGLHGQSPARFADSEAAEGWARRAALIHDAAAHGGSAE
jgi:hypothetical protein